MEVSQKLKGQETRREVAEKKVIQAFARSLHLFFTLLLLAFNLVPPFLGCCRLMPPTHPRHPATPTLPPSTPLLTYVHSISI